MKPRGRRGAGAGPISLQYPGKAPEGEAYAVEPAGLEVVREFGPPAADGWRNMLVWGDNLRVLRALLDDGRVRGRVTLVYTDPPFGTGTAYRGRRHVSAAPGDEVAYRDAEFGPEYLEFLRRRLVLIRDLLADDGSVYVHAGVGAAHYVRVLMDEVFGPGSFVNEIPRVRCNPKNTRRRAYGNVHDTILFYAKRPGRHVWNDPRRPYAEGDIARLFPKVDAAGRRYATAPLHAPRETDGPTGQPWRGIRPPPGKSWRYAPGVLEELDGRGLVEWSAAGNPRRKLYADERVGRGMKMQDVWLDYKDPPYPEYPTEKNLEMVAKIVEASSRPGDLVLDAFGGSGTTAVASEAAGRRWIYIDESPVAVRTALRRLLGLGPRRPFSLINATGGEVPADLRTIVSAGG